MTGEAVKEISEITKESLQIKEVNGKNYSTVQLHRIYTDKRPERIVVKSLTGIVDYLENNIDDLNKDKLIIHVVDHKTVDVLTNVHGEKNERHTVISARLDEIERFPFSEWIGQERFIIKCRSMFETTDDLESIIKYTAKIDQSSNVITEDDGITQNVNVKKGLSGVRTERENIPSLVKLRPYRTFTEVEQPESEFLFRMKTENETAKCSLFDADGGAWKNKARESIADFFQLTGVPVIA